MQLKTAALVATYLGAIVAANLVITHYGISATPYVAAGIVPLTFVVRDLLNDSWRKHFAPKMLALIGTGAVVSYVAAVELTAGPPGLAEKIALASALAFGISELVDWFAYTLAKRDGWSWLARSNTSNLFGAGLDSALFISVAFGFAFAPIFAQTVAKIAGGLVYSLLANPRKSREVLPRRPQAELAS